MLVAFDFTQQRHGFSPRQSENNKVLNQYSFFLGMEFNSEHEYAGYIKDALSAPVPGTALAGLIETAVVKAAEGSVAVLFSGGIDSSLIAFILKKHNIEFTCYTTALVEQGAKLPEDLVWAEKAAKTLGFKHEIAKISIKDLEKELPSIISIIGSSDPVKVGVAATLYFSLKLIKEGTVYSGLGSEEIFAGYQRHKEAKDVDEECRKGLYSMYQRDLERDSRLAEHFKVRLALPFMDAEVIRKAISMPDKIEPMEKMPLRKAALELGLPEEFALRKKKAAQYGSKVDWAIGKLGRQKRLSKKDYLASIIRT